MVYYVLAAVVLLYFGALVAINSIPHISVKSFGFFALRGITIDTPSHVFKIKKLRVKINLFRGRDSPLKLFNIELSNTNVELLGSSATAAAPLDIESLLKFVVPKKIYDLVFYYQILNQFHVLVYRFTISSAKDKTHRLYIDYAKVENCLRYDGHNSLTVMIFNGYLYEIDQEKTQLFRNIEVVVSCDAIFDCLVNRTDMEAVIMNFCLKVSVGKGQLPLDQLHIERKAKSSERPKSKDSALDVIKSVWKVVKEVRVTFEDVTVTSGPCVLNVATLQTSLVHEKDTEFGDSSTRAHFMFHTTSLKLYEADTKCLELPAFSLTAQGSPFCLIQGLENAFSPTTTSNPSSSDLSLNLTLTNPTVDLYHDQLIYFEIRKRTHATRPPRLRKINVLNVLLSLKKVSTKVVIIGSRVDIHVPKLGSHEFHRDSSSNLTTTYSLDAFSQRASIKDLSSSLLAGEKQNLYAMFKVKNFKACHSGNIFFVSKCNVLAIYSILDKQFSLKLNTKHIKLKSVNNAIFHFVREVRNRRIRLDNRLYNQLCESQAPEPATGPDNYDLFDVLPGIINNVKINFTEVQADIICKDGLPSQIYTDSDGNSYDLKDYGRGVSLRVSSITGSYKRAQEEISCTVRTLMCYTLSEFDLDYMSDFDVVSSYATKDNFSDISSLDSIQLAEREEEDLRQVKKVLDVPAVDIANNSARDKNRLSIKVSEVNGRFDIFFVWCTIYAISLIHMFKPTEERLCSKQEIQSFLGKQNKRVKIDFSVPTIAIVARLPHKVDVLLEFDGLSGRDVFCTQQLDFKYFRGYIVHPSTKLWARFLTIRDSSFSVSTIDELVFDLACKGIRLNIPHGFLFYTVIDNVVTFAKAIRQIKHNFGNLMEGVDDFSSLPQEARHAPEMPTVKIQSSVFGLSLESDPFENELSYILELGMVEQKIRNKKIEAFEAKAQSLRNSTIDSKIELQSNGVLQPNGSGRAPDTEMDASADLMTAEEAEDIIKSSLEQLEHELSMSWIMKFRKFRATKIHIWKERLERVWGKEEVPEVITEQFDILNYLPGPTLLGVIFRDLEFTLGKPSIPDLDRFLYDYGKGQPKVDYSILFPFYMELRSSAVLCYLKDYPLPLLSFPANEAGTPSFDLRGNVVINEKLIGREEELRRIWVPFSPPMAPERGGQDNFYSVFVTRTLTPVKFTVDLNCKIDSERAAMISWCKAYQPGLSAAMSAVDNFTKPKIDDSPLGWWDKMALTLHGQLTFDIPNELCFHMKSSTNPYGLTGKDAGFVFSWKNNVVFKIDGVGPSSNLITLNSDDFLLAIPNYSHAEKRTWSLSLDEIGISDLSNDIDSEAKKYCKKVMCLSSDEKVQWTLGFLFERNMDLSSSLSDRKERTDEFKPHYDVVVTGPQYQYHPDSYTAYRSDYLHLAISVKSVSSRGNASNNIHLTPLAFRYFFFWWHTITEAISLPVRQGPLFNDQPADAGHTKTSTHLFTVKYQLILEPLTISHMQVHAAGDRNKHVAFTGLKAKVDRFVVDLHQRKEVLTYVNKKLNIENQILHLKMNQAEISVEEADVRLVNAIFADKSMHSQLDHYLFGNSTADTSSGDLKSSDAGTTESPQFGYLKWLDNLEIEGGDFSWFDPQDFSELEMRELLSPYPQVTILPFFYTPQFTYIREFSLQEEGPYPFGAEASHDCELGKQSPESTQESLLSTRLKSLHQEADQLKEQLRAQKETAAQSPNGRSQNGCEKLQRALDRIRDKIDLVQTVYEAAVGRAPPDETDMSSTNSDNVISRYNSTSLSMYSSHKSIEDARRDGLLNKEVGEFHNRFIVHNLQLKWANRLRDLFMNYMQILSDKRAETYIMSKQAVDLVESVLNNVPEEFRPGLEHNEFCTDSSGQGEQVVNDFDMFLEEVEDTQEAEHKFLVKLINPQIQLISDKEPDSALLLVSKDLELRIITVNIKGVSKLINADSEISGLVETRYGGVFNDSSSYVFRKDQMQVSGTETVPYGFIDGELAVSWPPWVEVENIYEDTWLRAQCLTTKTSMALTFKRPNYLYVDASSVPEKNEITAYLGKLVINADSAQYSSLYHIITDLLVYSKSQKDSVLNKLEKVVSLADNDDFYGLDKRVGCLQADIREYHELLLKIDNSSARLPEPQKSQVHQVELELERKKLELSMIMRGLRLRNVRSSNKRAARSWLISVDQIIWHFLDEHRKPLIDLALANSRFHRSDAIDGSNKNKVLVGILQGFNLQKNAVYPELLAPINSDLGSEPLIFMSWSMLHPVGGIPIMQQAKLKVQGLKIQLDYTTAKLLFDYVFPKDDADDKKTRKGPKVPEKEPPSETSSVITDLSLDRPRNLLKRFTKTGSSPPSIPEDDFDTSSVSSRRTGKISTSSERSTSPAAEIRDSKEFKLTPKHQKQEQEDDLALIVSRSSKYFSIVDIDIEPFQLIISFKAPKHLSVIDVHMLSLHIPNIRYQNKTWSAQDCILRLRKDIIKIILQHTGHIIGNKFKVRKRVSLTSPLKQISNYASFVSLQELQGSEDSNRDSEPHRAHHHAHHSRSSFESGHQNGENGHTNGEDHSKPPRSTTVSFSNLLQEIIDEEDESN